MSPSCPVRFYQTSSIPKLLLLIYYHRNVNFDYAHSLFPVSFSHAIMKPTIILASLLGLSPAMGQLYARNYDQLETRNLHHERREQAARLYRRGYESGYNQALLARRPNDDLQLRDDNDAYLTKRLSGCLKEYVCSTIS